MIDPEQYVKAPACPHWVKRTDYESWIHVIGLHAASLMRCRRCMAEPVRTFGQPDKPGPTSGTPRAIKKRDLVSWLAQKG